MNSLKEITILVLDDEQTNLILVEEYLGAFCKQLLLQNDVETALTLACEKQPDLILLDICMYEIDGYEACRRLKANVKTQHIPVIFLSSLINPADKVKGFDVGGVDFISKPFALEEAVARIKCCLKLHQQIYQTQRRTVEDRAERIKQYQLTKREVQILTLYALGHPGHEIANQLFISDNTVKYHLKNILMKLEVSNRTQASDKAREIGLISQ